jgi:F-type H+-transporting ATPase subunit a
MGLIESVHAAEGITVKLSPYVVGELYGVPITATLITTWLTMALLVAFTLVVTRKLALVPAGGQNAVEFLIGGVYDYMSDVLESKTLAHRYFPVVMTIFIFVLALNWVGLLPGVTAFGSVGESGQLIPWLYPAATDLNITLAFAIVAFLTIEFAGVAALGIWRYGGKFINFRSPLAFIIGLIEFASEIARLISFSFRLFGNIFAGKTLLVVVMFFAPFIVPIPILAFEVFVGLIQAFIFAVLTLFFIKLAVAEPH